MLPSVIIGLLMGELTAPKQAPRALMAALRSLVITQGDGGTRGQYQQGFELVFSAERGRAVRGDYLLLTSPLLKAGQRVVVTVTVKARPRVLIDGVITKQELGGDNEPTITVVGGDLTVLMDMVQVGKRREGQGDTEAALDIIGKYKSYGIRPQVDDPETSSPATKEQRTLIQT
jgi:hypothetical protein